MVAALASAFFAARAVYQTKQMRKDARQPYVWADIRPDEEDGGLLLLVVGNSGPSMARNIRVNFSPPLPTTGDATLESAVAQQRLGEGLASLAPGRTIAWAIGASHLVGEGDWSDHDLTVLADGPFGPLDLLQYTFSINDILNTRVAASGTLFGITSAIKQVTQQLRQPGPALRSPRS